MSTRVFLLRHAESADPTIFHGAESDVALSVRGQRQAAVVAPVLAAYRPNAVVSSAMRRAVQTATPIAAACALPLMVEPALHERRVGNLSGTPFKTTDGVWPETLRQWIAGNTNYAPAGAESFDAIQGRVLPVWQRLTVEYAGQTLVVVAHGVVCRVLLLSVLSGMGAADWQRFGPMANVGITELVGCGPTWQAVQVNQVPESVRTLQMPASTAG
jgi:2,3-bisphosphoglycerate-dependent phosphoglycerate mutase